MQNALFSSLSSYFLPFVLNVTVPLFFLFWGDEWWERGNEVPESAIASIINGKVEPCHELLSPWKTDLTCSINYL
jgi:hypothetical protein